MQSLTHGSHASWRKVGLLDASASPVGSQDSLGVAERAVSIATGQLSHRVSDNAIRPQTQLCQQVNLSDLQ